MKQICDFLGGIEFMQAVVIRDDSRILVQKRICCLRFLLDWGLVITTSTDAEYMWRTPVQRDTDLLFVLFIKGTVPNTLYIVSFPWRAGSADAYAVFLLMLGPTQGNFCDLFNTHTLMGSYIDLMLMLIVNLKRCYFSKIEYWQPWRFLKEDSNDDPVQGNNDTYGQNFIHFEPAGDSVYCMAICQFLRNKQDYGQHIFRLCAIYSQRVDLEEPHHQEVYLDSICSHARGHIDTLMPLYIADSIFSLYILMISVPTIEKQNGAVMRIWRIQNDYTFPDFWVLYCQAVFLAEFDYGVDQEMTCANWREQNAICTVCGRFGQQTKVAKMRIQVLKFRSIAAVQSACNGGYSEHGVHTHMTNGLWQLHHQILDWRSADMRINLCPFNF